MTTTPIAKQVHVIVTLDILETESSAKLTPARHVTKILIVKQVHVTVTLDIPETE